MNLQAVLYDTVVKPAMFTVLLSNELAILCREVTPCYSIAEYCEA